MRSHLIVLALFILCPLFQAEDIQVTLVAPDSAMSEGATDTASVTLNRTGNTTNPLTVALTFTAGTAGQEDLASMPSEVTFPAGSSSATFTLTAIEDGIEEEDESFAIGITPGTGYAVGDAASATITIRNGADLLPVNADVESSIGSPGDRDQFALTIASAGLYRIDVFGAGADGMGYTLEDGFLRLYATNGVALLASDDDGGAGLDPRITRQLQPGTYFVEVAGYADVFTGTYGLHAGLVPPVITIAATYGRLTEGVTDTGAITLARTGDASNSLSVALSFTAGTADAADLQVIPAEATFAAGASTTAVALTAVDDGIEEGDEFFTVNIAAGAGYEIGYPASAQKSIADPTGILPLNTLVESSIGFVGDRNRFALTIETAGRYRIDELGTGASDASYTLYGGAVNLFAADGVTVVAYGYYNFLGLDTRITTQLQPGTYIVEVAGYYNAGTYGLRASLAPPLITIAASDVELTEGSANTGAITLARTGDTVDSLSVALAFAAGTAIGADLQEVPTVATFAAGASTTRVVLAAVDDGIEEEDEMFTVGIATGAGYEIGYPSSAQMTIAAPVGALPLNTLVESSIGFYGDRDQYILTIATAGTYRIRELGSGASDAAYTLAYGTLRLLAEDGVTTLAYGVNSYPGYDGELIVGLQPGTYIVEVYGYYYLGTYGLRADLNPAKITLYANDVRIVEGSAGERAITLMRTGDMTNSLTVSLGFTAGTADATDLESVPTEVVFPAGSNAASITLRAVEDAIEEDDETFTIGIAAGAGYEAGYPARVQMAIEGSMGTLPLNTLVEKSIGYPGDRDRFVLTIATEGLYRINELGSGATGAGYSLLMGGLYLFASDGANILAYGNYTYPNFDQRITAQLQPGTYIVEVAGYNNAGSYGLQASLAPPIISISESDVELTEGSTNTGSITLARTGDTANALSVALSFTVGGAVGTDLQSVPTVATFAAGDSNTTITLAAVDEAIDEEDESFTVGIAAGAGYEIGYPASVQMTIAAPTGTLPLDTLVESSIGFFGDRDRFSLTITTAGLYQIQVFGSGASGSPYTLNYGALHLFAADGVTSLGYGYPHYPSYDQRITVQLQPGTYIIELSTYYYTGTYGLRAGLAPPVITITASDAELTEVSTNSGSITLARTGDATNPLSVALSFTAGTAVGADLQEVPTVATFAAGASTTTIALTAVDDAIVDEDETFTVGIASGAGYEIGYPASVQMVITGPVGTLPLDTLVESSIGYLGDSDRYALTITTAGSYRIHEFGSGSNKPAYTLYNETLRLIAPDGVTVLAYGYSDYSSSERRITATLQPGTYFVEVAGYSYYGTGTYGLQAGLAPPIITVRSSDSQMSEGSTDTGVITLARMGDTTDSLSVALSFSSGTAVGADLREIPAVATFAAGSSTATVALVAVDDAIEEEDETFTIGIAAGAGYEIGNPASVQMIIAAPTGALSLNGLVEGSIGFSSDRDRFALTITTAGLYRINQLGSGAEGSRYTLSDGYLYLYAADGVTVVTFDDDSGLGYDAQITRQLQPGTYIVEVAGFGDSRTGTYGLQAGLAPSTITAVASDVQITEGSTATGVITLARTGDATSALTVSLSFTAGTAEAADLQSVPTEVTFAAGASTTTVSLTAVDDAIEEDDETFSIGIATGAGYEIGSPATVQLTIAGPTGTLPLNALVESSIGFSGDRDRFALTITAAGLYRIQELGSGAGDAAYTLYAGALRLFAADGVTVVAYGENNYPNYDGKITAQLQPGTYMVEVAGNYYYTGTYGLRAGLAPPSVTISASNAQLREGSIDSGVITLTRTGDTANALTVSLSFMAGRAVAADLQSVPTEATFVAGASTTSVCLTAVDDAIQEDDEDFTVSIAPGAGYDVGYSSSVRMSIAGPTGALPLNALVEDSIDFMGDRDRYALTIPVEGLYRIDRFGSGDNGARYTLSYSRIRLFAADGVAEISNGGYYPPYNDGQITAQLRPGTYIVEIAGYGDFSMGTYGLRASVAPPIITIAARDGQLTEGSTDVGAIALARTGDTASALTVSISFTAGTAVAADLQSVPAEATFAAGAMTTIVSLAAVDDGIEEDDEFFTLAVAPGAGYEVGYFSSVRIGIAGPSSMLPLNTLVESSIGFLGDLDRYVLTIDTEGLYRIVQYGAGTNGAQYTLPYSSLRLLASDGVTVMAYGGYYYPNNEGGVTVHLQPGSYMLEVAGTGDNYTGSYGLKAFLAPPIITVVRKDAQLVEGATDANSITLTRTGDTSGSLTVSLSFTSATAVSADLQSVPTEASFAAGASTATILLKAVEDGIPEDDEIFTVGIAAGVGYEVGYPSSVSMVISGPAGALPLNSVVDGSIEVAGDRDRFVLTIPAEGVYRIGQLGRDGDRVRYDLHFGSLRLYAADGVSLIAESQGFETHVDAQLKPGTYLVEMAGFGDYFAGTYGLLAELAPAVEVSIAASDPLLTEGPTDTGTIVLTRTGDTTNTLTVSLAFSAGTASAADLQSIPDEATFSAGSSTTVVTLTAVEDKVAEDDEYFAIGVTAGSGYTVSRQANVGMVISGSTRPLPLNVMIEDSIDSFGYRDRFSLAIEKEGAYQIDLLGYGGNNPQYSLFGGRIRLQDANGKTLVETTGSVGPSGDARITTLLQVGEYVVEVYGYGFRNIYGLVARPSSATVVSVAASDAELREGSANTGTIVLTRTGDTTDPLTVALSFAAGTAELADLQTLPPQATFAAGSSTATVTLAAIDDMVVEEDESFTVGIAAGEGYVVGNPGSVVMNIVAPTEVLPLNAIVERSIGILGDRDRFGLDITSAGLYRIHQLGSGVNNPHYSLSDGFLRLYAADGVTMVADNDDGGSGLDAQIATRLEPGTYFVEVAGFKDARTGTYGLIASRAPTISIASLDGNMSEAGDTAVIQVTRDAGFAEELSVPILWSGTADASDYVADEVHFAAGAASVTVVVTAVPDAEKEDDETVMATLGASDSYNLGENSSVALVIQGDPQDLVQGAPLNASLLDSADTDAYTVLNPQGTLGIRLEPDFRGVRDELGGIKGVANLWVEVRDDAGAVVATMNASGTGNEATIRLPPGAAHLVVGGDAGSYVLTARANETPVIQDLSLRAVRGSSARGTVVATDANSDPLEFRIDDSTVDAGNSVAINSATGEMVYTPAPHYEGVDLVTVRVSDGFGWVTKSVQVTISESDLGGSGSVGASASSGGSGSSGCGAGGIAIFLSGFLMLAVRRRNG